VRLIATGDISDYTTAVKSAIAQRFAMAAGVPLDSVHVEVESASVAISVTVVLPNASAGADDILQVQTTFKRLLSTPRAATQFLSSVASGSIHVIHVDENPQALAPLSPPISSIPAPARPYGDLSSSLKEQSKSLARSLPIVIGVSLGGLAVIQIAICIYRLAKLRRERRANALLEARVDGLVQDGGMRRREMRSVSFVTHAQPIGFETKLVTQRKEVLSDHI